MVKLISFLLILTPLPNNSEIEIEDLNRFDHYYNSGETLSEILCLRSIIENNNDKLPDSVKTEEDRKKLQKELGIIEDAWEELALARIYDYSKDQPDRVKYHLKRLKNNIGEEAYKKGNMPSPVPLKWFPQGHKFFKGE